MFKSNKIKVILMIMLSFSVCVNIYFLTRKDKTLTPDTIGYTIFRASKSYNLGLLNDVVWERDGKYWESKINEMYGKSSNRMTTRTFTAIMYDNGNTLIVELGEDLKGNLKAGEAFFLDDNLDFLKFNFYR